MKTSLTIFGATVMTLLALTSEGFAALPVDIFQDMESGHDGDLLTPEIMNASSHGGPTTWTITGRMWVSTRNSTDLPGPVTVSDVTCAGTGGTRSWMFNDANQLNYVKCSLPGRYAKITVVCYFATGVTIPWVQFDSISFAEVTERTWGVLQVETEDRGGPLSQRQCRKQDHL